MSISGENNPFCASNAPDISGKMVTFGRLKFNSAGLIGHFGAFANDAARICGGENVYGEQDTCYQLDLRKNIWEAMRPKMLHKRYIWS